MIIWSRRKLLQLFPPREDAIIWTDKNGEDLDHPWIKAILEIEKVGPRKCEQQSEYHRRSKAEVAMFRFKKIFGPKAYAREFEN